MDKCTVQAHSKKLLVDPNTLYISDNKTSAYSYPRLPIESIGGTLNLMLNKLHPREDWLKIFNHT